jgi:opacity protein-like surface antigen
MAGLIASSGAQAQCEGTNVSANQLFPFGSGSSVNALTSVIETVNTAFLTNTTAFISAPGNPAPDQEGGGAWSRVIAGTVQTQTAGSFSFPALNVTTGSRPFCFPGGTVNSETKVQQDYAGFQAGRDISVLNDSLFGANWHFGATAGYVESYAKDITPAGGDQSAGTLKTNFEVPFVGVYGAVTKGNFYADGQVRFDYYQAELSDPITSGIFNQRLDARSWSLTGNLGYRFDMPQNWFIEPSVGGVYSHVSVDPLDLSGTYVIPNNPGFAFPGTVKINDFDSELGRVGVRVGTTIKTDDVIAQPFFVTNVYHEFAGDVTTTITARGDQLGALGITAPPETGLLTTSRIGTYAQFGFGSNFQLVADPGWLGYIRVDYRTGENIEGWAVNAGLRYQLAGEAGSLKDAPGSLKDGPAPVLNWTGLYIGTSSGATAAYEHWTYQISGDSVNPDMAGYLIGGQAGYNYQIGSFVAGIEGDWDYTNARGAKSCPNLFFWSCENDADQLGSVAARLGYTWGRALFYAKGGWAFGDIKEDTHYNASGATYSTTLWANGWTLGGGVEIALTDRWSAKAEYMHYDLGNNTYTVDNGLKVNTSTDGDIVRVGVNYHIGFDYVPYK